MNLVVKYSDRPSCYVGLHSSDANTLFASLGVSRHFCRPLRLDASEEGARKIFVGWVGDSALTAGKLEIAGPFAECLGLREGDVIKATAVTDAVIAPSVMVQPSSIDDWEVVELQATFIEEHLLSQIAVLSPGMTFTIWIHGQMPVKLRIDARDSNRADCFLLDRNSELAIESKRRPVESADGKPAEAIFGGTKQSAGEGERKVHLRVLAATPSATGTFDRLDAPTALLHPQELEALAGGAAPDHCLAWLRPRRARGAQGSPRLFMLQADASVPRSHIFIGSCLAMHAGLPSFTLVSLWRCRQVPVYVPHIELVPLAPRKCWGGSSLLRLFRDFVSNCGEVDVMDGAILMLRQGTGSGGWLAQVDGSAALLGSGDVLKNVISSSSEATDLYEGLSDIDDIYQCNGVDAACAAGGIHEIDLGLDDHLLPFPASPPLQGEMLREGKATTGPAGPEGLSVDPEDVPVCVRFVLRAAREDLQHAHTPPFLHLSSSMLDSDVKVTLADEETGTAATKVGTTEHRVSADALETLWSAVKGLSSLEEGWREVVRLVNIEHTGGSSCSPATLDELDLFKVPAGILRKHILGQLGCLAPDSSEPDGKDTNPLEPRLPSNIVPGGTAVMGTTGTGKSILCRRVLAELEAQGVLSLEVACTKLGQPGRKFKAVQDWLYAIFQFACWYSPSVIFLDDFGALCPDVENGAMSLSITEERSAFLSEFLLDLLPEVRSSGARVAVVATFTDQSAIHRSLWCHPAMEHKVSLRSPMLKERPEILRRLCRAKATSSSSRGFMVDESLAGEGALDDWGGQVDGFSVADLSRLVDRACIEATVEASDGALNTTSPTGWAGPPSLALRHLQRAQADFVPTMLADQNFFSSELRLSDIGGMEEAKQSLMDMLTMPTKYAILIDRAPVRGHRGMILVGPPGCGKTMLVHAAANETKGLLRFLAVKGPELLSKYIGASEAGVRQVFERAAAAAPAVLFFDEIEALAPRRGADSTGVTDRVVNQMLCYLDGVEDRGRVFVVAATGRPDLVDPALMRPGRFDKVCYCGLPTEAEKLQVCEILAKKNNLVSKGSSDLHHDLQVLVSRIPRLFTCADLNALFSSAKIEAVNEALKADVVGSKRAPAITMAHLYEALATAKASVSEADDHRYNQVFAAYRPGAKHNAMREGPDPPPKMKVALA